MFRCVCVCVIELSRKRNSQLVCCFSGIAHTGGYSLPSLMTVVEDIHSVYIPFSAHTGFFHLVCVCVCCVCGISNDQGNVYQAMLTHTVIIHPIS